MALAPWTRGRIKAAALITTLLALLVPCGMASAEGNIASAQIPQGVWTVDGKAAVQLYDCNGLLCGRLRWLHESRDAQGQIKRDKSNPDPGLRQRELCGLTLIWNLHPTAPDRWEGGSFYDPNSGKTHSVSLERTPSDQIVARFYDGFKLVGETKILSRGQPAKSEGWC